MAEQKSTIGTVISAATLIASGAVTLLAAKTAITGVVKKQGAMVISIAFITMLVGVAAFRYSKNELTVKES